MSNIISPGNATNITHVKSGDVGDIFLPPDLQDLCPATSTLEIRHHSQVPNLEADTVMV
jgi:hypothetical protein